ncbi:MAG: hypothetical protein GYA57_19705 [Myxococcales bacterium]|nr:hypothetical protein [Myxococcales bacterium]
MARLVSMLVAVATLTLPAANASAQIYVHGGISVGATFAVPAPPVVVYDYAPPPVYVVQQPAPPPVVVVRPAPAPVVRPMPAAVVAPPEEPFESEFGIGTRVNAGITGAESAAMGGGGLFLRLHTFPNLQFELAVDGFAGEGYGGAVRSEVPVEFSALWFFGNHSQRFRLFLLGGIGASWAQVGEGDRIDEPWYLGALGGIGVEWRLIDWLALEADVRGFIRQRVNERPDDPAYATDPMWNDGNCDEEHGCTDLQGGGTFHLGAILYF